MTPRMNFKCGKTRTYTSGKPRAHTRVDHETTPINTFGESLVVNGPPSSPKHIPTLGGLSVQIVFLEAFLRSFFKRRMQSVRLIVTVSFHCNLGALFSGNAELPGCNLIHIVLESNGL